MRYFLKSKRTCLAILLLILGLQFIPPTRVARLLSFLLSPPRATDGEAISRRSRGQEIPTRPPDKERPNRSLSSKIEARNPLKDGRDGASLSDFRTRTATALPAEHAPSALRMFRAGATKPTYLLIFLPATPQNHRSPPA